MPDTTDNSPNRRTLVRDVAVLQVKLVVDGLRDLVLVPASLIAGLVSLFSSADGRTGDQFYQLLAVGKQSERWINLFGAMRNAPVGLRQADQFPNADIDDLVGRLETFVVDEHRRGGITAQAKERLDKTLRAIRRKRRERGEQP